MAVTHHCKNKTSARKLAHHLRKKGNMVSMNKRTISCRWSVTAWKK